MSQLTETGMLTTEDPHPGTHHLTSTDDLPSNTIRQGPTNKTRIWPVRERYGAEGPRAWLQGPILRGETRPVWDPSTRQWGVVGILPECLYRGDSTKHWHGAPRTRRDVSTSDIEYYV